jgi:ankyrin repeat protein
MLILRFLLAKLRMDDILSVREPRRRLQALHNISRSDDSVSKAYKGVVERIELADRDLAFRVFSWLFRSRRILHMDELLEALVVEVGDTDLDPESLLQGQDIIKSCNRLVMYEELSEFVRFSHVTVHEYFRNNISLLPPNSHLAMSCLTYLMFNVFSQCCHGKSAIEKRLNIYKFSRYAVENWGFHVKESEDNRQVQETVLACFMSQTRRDAILQMEVYGRSNGRSSVFTEGQTLLHMLADKGLAKTCALALEMRSEVVQPSYISPSSSELTKRQVDVMMKDKRGETPLHCAALYGHDDVIQILLAAGTDVMAKRKDGATSLHCAASNGHDTTVSLLLSANADMNAVDNNKCTPLILAAWHGHDSVVQILLGAGAELWAEDNRNWTAIDYAKGRNHETTRDMLQDADNPAPLIQAASNGEESRVQKLLQDGADVSTQAGDRETALHRAAQGGYNTIVITLLDSGAQLEAKSRTGATALHKAAAFGRVDVTKTLLREGADFTTVSKTYTALHIAAMFGELGVMNLLLNAMRVLLDSASSSHLSSAKHKEFCISSSLRLLQCLVDIFPDDDLLQRGLANQYFREKMFEEARESYDYYIHLAMRCQKAQLTDVRHFRYYCNECRTDLKGITYKCGDCSSDYDACQTCFTSHQHPIEVAIRIPSDDSGYLAQNFQELLTTFQQSSLETLFPEAPYSFDASLGLHGSTSNKEGTEERRFEISWMSPHSVVDSKFCASIQNSVSITVETNGEKQVVTADKIGKYVESNWGRLGFTVLDAFLDVLQSVLGTSGSGKASVLFERSTFNMEGNSDFLAIGGKATSAEWVSVIECLIWLEQILDAPKRGFAYRPWHAESSEGQSRVKISFKPEISIYARIPPFDLCWSQLIKSTYVGHRRIQVIGDNSYGIRIPFGVMIELAAIEQVLSLNDGIILTGYNTALIPIAKLDDNCIVWHAIFMDKSTDADILTTVETELERSGQTPLNTSIPSYRSIGYLGWDPHVETVLGLKTVETSPGRSRLKSSDHRYRASRSCQLLASIVIPIFPIANVQFAAARGQTHERMSTNLQYSLGDSYESRIDSSFHQLVVIYCTLKKLAWLVPKINVILYMIRVKLLEAPTSTSLPDIRYPRQRSYDKALKEMKRLENKVIIQGEEPESKLLFRHVFNRYADALQNALQEIKDLNDDASIYGVELLDIINPISNPAKRLLPVSGSIKCWKPLLGNNGIIVCHGLHDVLETFDRNNSCSLEIDALKNRVSGVLSCIVGDLKVWMESDSSSSWDDISDYKCVEKCGWWKWILTGNPYSVHSGDPCSVACWRAKLQSVKDLRFLDQVRNFFHNYPPIAISNEMQTLNESRCLKSGLCFGEIEGD